MKSEPTYLTRPISGEDIDQLENIELLFFAYRDFISDPDKRLSDYNFGRAHHRVLYFVNRSPGMTVAELLDILRITKQSLGRVLKQLIESGHIVQTEGMSDRRKRLLYPTETGRELILELSKPQSERLSRALASLDESQKTMVVEFLRGMINQKS
ncbi:MAG: MarR family winged helix-turn-helix transcriptional regulator [Rhizobiaceae bacterium]